MMIRKEAEEEEVARERARFKYTEEEQNEGDRTKLDIKARKVIKNRLARLFRRFFL